jgi:uncharacterized protein YbjT (DUF2867 family)
MIVVAGATGLLGGDVAERLRARGVPYRAVVRDPAAAAKHEEAVVADLTRPETLTPAVEGAETVISGVTAISRRLAGDKSATIRAVDERGTLALVDAAQRVGVARFVFVSFPINATMRRAPLAQAKLRVEERLARSPLRAVIVAPDMFQEIWLSKAVQLDWQAGKAIVVGKGETRHSYVAVADVAEAVVRLALADDPPLRVEPGGPEALTRKEVIARFEAATGRPLKARHVPRSLLRAGSAALARVQPVQASLMAMAYAADVDPMRTSAEPLRALGIEPRPASAYIDDVVRAG